MRESVLSPGARQAYERLSDADRAEVDRLIRLIELDPWADDVHKIEAGLDDQLWTTYNNGTWVIGYTLPDDATVAIRGISRVNRTGGLRL